MWRALGPSNMEGWIVGVVAAALVGCGPTTVDLSDSGSDANGLADVSAPDDASDGGAPYPAPHSSPPQVRNYGGVVMTAPTVIPIFFANDSEESQVEEFLKQLAQSSFWGEATAEYGAGPLTVGTSIVVTDPPPPSIDTAQIEAWLAGYLDGTHVGWPPISPNEIFAVLYPSTSTVTSPALGTSCTNFGGFHTEGQASTSTSFAFAVLPRCTSGVPKFQGLDGLTSALSHELVEASTDPFYTSPAWIAVDDNHMVWNVVPAGEVGDLCATAPQSFQRLVGPYLVQRPWSNASALAGHDPCVPLLAQPYFNAAPILTDAVAIAYQGQSVVTQGVELPLSATKTIDVQLFSDAPMNDWSVSVGFFSQTEELSGSWDEQAGNNGDTLHLTLTRIANGAATLGGTEFVIVSASGSSKNYWYGFASN